MTGPWGTFVGGAVETRPGEATGAFPGEPSRPGEGLILNALALGSQAQSQGRIELHLCVHSGWLEGPGVEVGSQVGGLK